MSKTCNDYKICSKCNNNLEITAFFKGRTYCKQCKYKSNFCIHNRCKYSCKHGCGGNICEHNNIKNICKQCGGGSICEHNKLRTKCKECGGGSICEHNKLRTNCKECGGGSLCEHNKQKNICKECKGSSICEHSRIKSTCKECGGSSICEHSRIKSSCKECKGSAICEHNKQKNTCKECKGSAICEHNKIKYRCKECKGSAICEHNKLKEICKECKGTRICEHNKVKYNCIKCNPSSCCRECKLTFVNIKTRFYPLCEACFCNKYPDNILSKRFKIKETYLLEELKTRFKHVDIKMINDKKIEGGCSSRRPDILIDLLIFSIVIECDEKEHSNYKCENKRNMELFEDLGNRPLIIIRFNPDSYNIKNKKIQGCFKDITKIEDIHKKKFYDLNIDEWNKRIDTLEKLLIKHISMKDAPDKELTIEYLFYSC